MITKLFAALIVAGLTSVSAHAIVIDFESTGTPGSYNALDYTIDGFVFNQTMDNIDISSTSPWAGNGPAYSGSFAGLNNYGGAGEVTAFGGGTFSFQSLWLKSWYGNVNPMTVSGWLNGVQVGTVNGQSGTSWVEYVGNFANIDKLVINGGNYFLVDNISLNTQVSAVPEPETYAMLLAGLGLVGFKLRRQNK